MATGSEIEAARAVQRAAAEGGTTVGYRAALEFARHPPVDVQAQTIAALGLELAQLKGELARLKAELAAVRVVGVGHSGEGPRGMMFNPEALDGNSNSATTTGGLTDDFDFFDGDDGLLKVAHYVNGLLTSVTT